MVRVIEHSAFCSLNSGFWASDRAQVYFWSVFGSRVVGWAPRAVGLARLIGMSIYREGDEYSRSARGVRRNNGKYL